MDMGSLVGTIIRTVLNKERDPMSTVKGPLTYPTLISTEPDTLSPKRSPNPWPSQQPAPCASVTFLQPARHGGAAAPSLTQLLSSRTHNNDKNITITNKQ